ncbi:unnamed protein product, partial [marine sediment metagenome]
HRIRRTFGPTEYMAFLELQRNGTPHFHVLTRGSYIPQKWLSDAWHSLTGAFKVDIRQVRRVAGAVAEVTKYLTKTAGDLQTKAPGVAIVTRSRGWLPPDFDDTSEPADPHAHRLYVGLTCREISATLQPLGGSLRAVPDSPGKCIVVLPRPPTHHDLGRLISDGSWSQAAFALLLLHRFNPDYVHGPTFADELELLWDSFRPGVGRHFTPAQPLATPAPSFADLPLSPPVQHALFPGGLPAPIAA